MEEPNLIHSKAAMKKSLAARSGQIIRMERYSDIGTAIVPLGNTGITPPSKAMNSMFIDAQINFYGTWVEINEQVDLTSQSPVLNQRAKLLGRSLRQTEDELMRACLLTTATVIGAVGGVNGDTPTEITLSDVQECVRRLRSHDAKTISSTIEGSNKFGTAPVPNAFLGLGHSNISSVLENINGFVGTHQYGSKDMIDVLEVGALSHVRFLLSSRGSVTPVASANNHDVYNTFIVGMEAYTGISLEKNNANFVYHDSRTAGGPLELNSTGGWKMAHAHAIVNDAWVCNLKSTL